MRWFRVGLCGAMLAAAAGMVWIPPPAQAVLSASSTSGSSSVTAPRAVVRPVRAGAVSLIAVSDLHPACARCAGGIGFADVTLTPPEAGQTWANRFGLVVRAASTYVGDARLGVRLVDATGTGGESVTLRLAVVRSDPHSLAARSVIVILDAVHAGRLDLAALGYGATERPTVLDCGQTLHGTVRCTANGMARYRGSGEPDQFTYRLMAGGEQATATVTLVPPQVAVSGGPTPAAPEIPGGTVVRTIFAPPPPDLAGAPSADSAVRAFWDTLAQRGPE